MAESKLELDPRRIRVKIVFLLGIYPILMPSMLQVGIGPHVGPKIWRPVLDELIQQGIVLREEIVTPTPLGQHRSYTLLHLRKGINVDEWLKSEGIGVEDK